MHAYWIDHDHLEVPQVASSEDEADPQVVGDGMITVTEGDPLFKQWRRWALNARPDPEPDGQPTE